MAFAKKLDWAHDERNVSISNQTCTAFPSRLSPGVSGLSSAISNIKRSGDRNNQNARREACNDAPISLLCVGASPPMSGRYHVDREDTPRPVGDIPPSRNVELLTFILLAIVIWPILAIGLVGGYGFLIWTYQSIAGPPGPPH
jgi:periplasmic nitrate reductase NapE